MLDLYTILCVYLVMKNEIKKKGNKMGKIVLSGNMIELDINEIDSHLTEDINNSAMRVAMEDMDMEGELSELDMVETREFIEFG